MAQMDGLLFLVPTDYTSYVTASNDPGVADEFTVQTGVTVTDKDLSNLDLDQMERLVPEPIVGEGQCVEVDEGWWIQRGGRFYRLPKLTKQGRPARPILLDPENRERVTALELVGREVERLYLPVLSVDKKLSPVHGWGFMLSSPMCVLMVERLCPLPKARPASAVRKPVVKRTSKILDRAESKLSVTRGNLEMHVNRLDGVIEQRLRNLFGGHWFNHGTNWHDTSNQVHRMVSLLANKPLFAVLMSDVDIAKAWKERAAEVAGDYRLGLPGLCAPRRHHWKDAMALAKLVGFKPVVLDWPDLVNTYVARKKWGLLDLVPAPLLACRATSGKWSVRIHKSGNGAWKGIAPSLRKALAAEAEAKLGPFAGTPGVAFSVQMERNLLVARGELRSTVEKMLGIGREA